MKNNNNFKKYFIVIIAIVLMLAIGKSFDLLGDDYLLSYLNVLN